MEIYYRPNWPSDVIVRNSRCPQRSANIKNICSTSTLPGSCLLKKSSKKTFSAALGLSMLHPKVLASQRPRHPVLPLEKLCNALLEYL